MCLSDKFLSMVTPEVHKGDSILFWKDQWDMGLLRAWFPQLFSFAKRPNCSFKAYLSSDNKRNFHLSMSTIAVNQLAELNELLEHIQLDDTVNDVWGLTWGADQYTSKKKSMKM